MLSDKDHAIQVRHRSACIHCTVEGEGPAVLLLHGGLSHSGMLDRLRDHFIPDHTVIRLDARGIGRSSLGSEGLSYALQEADAFAVLDAVNVDKVSIVGSSDGGIVGMRMAIAQPDRVERLVTAGSRRKASDGAAMHERFKLFSKSILMNTPLAEGIEYYEAVNPDPNFDRLIELSVAMWLDDSADGHPGDRIEAIKSPMLITAGERDEFMPPGANVDLHSRVAGAQLCIVPGAGHIVMDDAPEIFYPVLDRFWRQAA